MSENPELETVAAAAAMETSTAEDATSVPLSATASSAVDDGMATSGCCEVANDGSMRADANEAAAGGEAIVTQTDAAASSFKEEEGTPNVSAFADDTQQNKAVSTLTEPSSVEPRSATPPPTDGNEPRSEATSTDGAAAMDTTAPDARPWDFSNRKVMVIGVTKFHDVKTVTKMVNKWLEDMNTTNTNTTTAKQTTDTPKVMAFDKIKKPPQGTWMVVTMQTEAMVQPLIDYINNNNNEIRNKRGEKLTAKLVLDDDAGGDDDNNFNNNRGSRKRRGFDDDHDNGGGGGGGGDNNNKPQSKRQRNTADGAVVQNARRPITVEELKDKVTPLWKLTTQEQLDQKMKLMIKKCAMKIIQEIKLKFRYVLEKQ